MTSSSEGIQDSGNRDAITHAAQWLANRGTHRPDVSAPTLPEIATRFGLTDADAAEAILLAGNYSLCRRAFG